MARRERRLFAGRAGDALQERSPKERRMTRRVLFGWELGEGNGHLRPYLSLLRALSSEGWEVAVAQRNTSVAAGELASTGWPVFQSPVCLNEFSGISSQPASHTEIFLGFGFAHPETLVGLVSGWRAIFKAFGPDLIIGNYAPSLMLAAHASAIPAIRLGTGFNCPPHDPRTPLILPWSAGMDERIERAEALASRTANTALRAFDVAPLGSLSAALEGSATLLASVPALDPFAPRPASHEHLGPMPVPRLPAVGAPPEIFASLRMDHPQAEPVLQALLSSGCRAWAYVPDATTSWCARISNDKVCVSNEPFDVTTALSGARAVVSYGGHSLSLSSLLAGCPHLMLPIEAEQAGTAMRVARLGAGIVVGREDRRSKIAASLSRILAEPAYRTAAQTAAAAHQQFSSAAAIARAMAVCERQARSPRGNLRIAGSSR
jgi:UDP:flavonoid glycosyltransferase YjiC (YdhE family)